MKKGLDKIIKQPVAIYFFLIVTYIPFWIAAPTSSGDDIAMFRGVLEHQNILEYSVNRYFSWSSRNILEVFTVLFCNYVPFIVWKVLNLGFYFLMFTTLWELFMETMRFVICHVCDY